MRAAPRAVFVSLVSLAAIGCGAYDLGSSVAGAADGGVPGAAPSQPPPTGTRWEGVPTETCGREGIVWVLVDEVCGGTGRADYLDGFTVPMFRDGALDGSTLYAVDGTHVWVLDVTDPEHVARRALAAGPGQPLAVQMHAERLVVAAGGGGLVVLDVTDPAAPATAAAVALPGPALGVHVDGDTAYVAAGDAGLAVVDLAAAPPALVKTLAVPGFAVAAAVRDGRAFVAACDRLAVLDVATGQLLGETWVDGASAGGRLVAPAKGVALAGTVAYVAAGRFGAVAIDVADPATPVVLGNCTIPEDQSFYASGVRADAARLYVAGGEWGILPVPLDPLAAACTTLVQPDLPPDPTDSTGSTEGCTTDPPWEVMPWEESWTPPPPPPTGRDPVQTLPAGGRVYAFGDARRIGVRAVEIRDGTQPSLPRVGRYEEPQLLTDLAAAAGRVLVVGPAGGLFDRDEALLLVPTAGTPPPEGVAGTVLEDGRWVVATSTGTLYVEGAAAPYALPLTTRLWAHGVAARGTEILVPADDRLWTISLLDDWVAELPLGQSAVLPPAIAADAGAVVLAAPEWPAAMRFDWGQTRTLEPHGIFDETEIRDPGRWQEGLPRRLLALAPRGIVEVAALGRRAGLVLHGATTGRVALPRGTYQAIAAAGDLVYLVAIDRGLYRSQLITVQLADGDPAVVAVEAFSGMARGIAVDADRVYVGDADRGVRIYARAGATLAPLGLVPLAPPPSDPGGDAGPPAGLRAPPAVAAAARPRNPRPEVQP